MFTYIKTKCRCPDSPQLCLPVQSDHFADHLLAEAVAHEEHRVFRDIGNQGRTGALVEATEAHLGVGLQATVSEAPVEAWKRLHLHLHGVEGLPSQYTCCAP